jgi:hypothetical protein
MQFVQKLFTPHTTQRRLLFVSALAALSGVFSAQAAFASNVTISSPTNGTTTQSPVWIRAHNIGCNGEKPTAFRFSIDNSSTSINGDSPYDIDVTHYAISTGKHTIHFKSWVNGKSCPMVNSTITVTGTNSGSGSSSSDSNDSTSSSSASTSVSIPSNAVNSGSLEAKSGWRGVHDSGTPGSSHGSMVYPATTPVYDNAREYYMTYTARGGERWSLSFAKDSGATHFVLDTYVYVVNPSQLANLELDLNQVLSNGKTVIMGTQCSGFNKVWEWTAYQNGHYGWHKSSIACNPMSWSAKTWHHIQIGFHRDSSGVVTHDWVSMDGKKSSFSGAKANAAKSMGWEPKTLQMNVQMDGYSKSSGSVKIYLHKTTFYRW